MRWAQGFLPTLKEVAPAFRGSPEEWLLRAGLMGLSSAGYVWWPLGIRMLRKLQEKVRGQLLDAGIEEIGLPIVAPMGLWQRMEWPVGENQLVLRADFLDPERKGRFVLGGWQEPILAEVLAGWLNSYRNLPLVVFQLGLVGASEGGSVSKLAEAPLREAVQVYGFHASADSLHQNYQQLLQHIENLLEFLELPYWVAQADPLPQQPVHKLVVRLSGGNIPGSETSAFEPSQSEAAANQPETTNKAKPPTEKNGTNSGFITPIRQLGSLEEVAFCEQCGYTALRPSGRIGGRPSKPVPAASVLVGLVGPTRGGESLSKPAQQQEPVRCVPTPGARTIAEVTNFLKKPASQFLKTLVYLADGKPVAVLVRGDHQASSPKICRAFGISKLEMADPATVERVTGAPLGFSGPVGLKERIAMYADWDVQWAQNVIVGANQADAHLVGVCIGRDFVPDFFADLRLPMPGDPCPQCPANLEIGIGLSVAEAACLPKEASQPLELRFRDAQEQLQPILLHRLQLDLVRLLWATVAVHHDSQGLVWPERFSPWDILLVCLAPEDELIRKAAEELYHHWQASELEVLLDDRPLRPGVKFYDADLLGVPWRAVLGPKNYQQGQLELKHRRTGQKQMIPLAEAAFGVVEKVRSTKPSASA
ncbi:MAG: His/Gly/Thr/Pro-type tRNA ligase C-terminal domain-containing protein [Thermoguttaceae bacterium]|nr:His/Gly/Thr/Pro-type tRNA ligase C-terminal domain-containing protein [Thermoguttaceae bacterium]MDW8039744.1 YbaK/EbsC family protein [Thermoguttaceae bacterium]